MRGISIFEKPSYREICLMRGHLMIPPKYSRFSSYADSLYKSSKFLHKKVNFGSTFIPSLNHFMRKFNLLQLHRTQNSRERTCTTLNSTFRKTSLKMDFKPNKHELKLSFKFNLR